MKLSPNKCWGSEDCPRIPSVICHFFKDGHFLHARFQVEEPEECFAANIGQDGGNAWEDSCVEIFLKALDSESEYINFEFTSRGFCYAARGRDRFHRKEFLPTEYVRILRSATPPIFEDGKVRWEIKISIPAFLLGARTLDGLDLVGNIYKCADKARHPHYLTRFPITTERPDFHQPRFFRKIL